MTNTDLTALSNDEINRAIATEVMGYVSCDGPPRLSSSDGRTYYFAGCIFYWQNDVRPTQKGWNPATDDNNMRLVRAQLKRQGLQKLFCVKLWSMLIPALDAGMSWPMDWLMLDALPRQQAEAALAAVRAAKEMKR